MREKICGVINYLTKGSEDEKTTMMSAIGDTLVASRYMHMVSHTWRLRADITNLRPEVQRCTPPKRYVDPTEYHARQAQKFWASDEGTEKRAEGVRLGKILQGMQDELESVEALMKVTPA